MCGGVLTCPYELVEEASVVGVCHAQREELRLRGRAELERLDQADLRLCGIVAQLEVFARRGATLSASTSACG